jgi:hypothetical protein
MGCPRDPSSPRHIRSLRRPRHPWDTLSSFIDWALEVNLAPDLNLHQTSGSKMIANKTRQSGYERSKESGLRSNFTFDILFARYGGQQCTDVRDKVYGLLGIAGDGAPDLVVALSLPQLCELLVPHLTAANLSKLRDYFMAHDRLVDRLTAAKFAEKSNTFGKMKEEQA